MCCGSNPTARSSLHADLAALAPGQCNDMVVDATGRAYVGNFGFDMYGGEKPRDTCVIAVEPDGTAQCRGRRSRVPERIDDHPRRRARSSSARAWAARISAFDIVADGTPVEPSDVGRSSHADATVDGMCLDAEGAIWAACPFTGRVLRVREGGEIVDEIKGTHPGAFACMLGGRRPAHAVHLHRAEHVPEETRAARQGRIEAVEVDVPGAGLP